ncbi:MAG: glycosyltransferase family 4 protein [Nitrospiraceae bacterium]|nr:glycosyltransferase family 4 protein [Nitrospiraceae bacterium]
MRIFHFIYDHSGNPWVGGGGAVRALELYRRLAQRHEITIISGKYPGAKDYTADGIRFHFEGSPKKNYLLSTFCYAASAFRFLRRNGAEADLVVEDFAPWNPVFSRFAVNRPVVLHLNHREGAGILKRFYLLPGLPFYFLEKCYPRLFENITVLSDETRRKFGVNALILPAGLDERVLSDRAAEKEDFIFFAGRLHIRNKGLDTLFEAMRALPDERLVIAGRGPDEAKLREMQKSQKKLGIKNIEFAGFVSEEKKMDLMRKAKLFVLPSRFEGYGIVLLEASAGATPAVVSGIPELGFAVNAGFAVNFRMGDAKDLARKIKMLCENSPLRRQMGANGLKYAGENTWSSVAAEFENYAKGILSVL